MNIICCVVGVGLLLVFKNVEVGRPTAGSVVPMNHATLRHKILVVDDSADTRDMMAKLLEMESFAVLTAPDGNAGIYVATTERPDLIITDINMPNLNGIEMIKQLRQRPGFESIPIMASTAYGEGVAQDAIDAGANLAATKPVQFKSLALDIRELLEKSLSDSNADPNPAEKKTTSQ